jgi:hypothetical protein
MTTRNWWLQKPFVRRVLGTFARGAVRRALTELDQLSPERTQSLTLTRLIRQAQATRFGRDHDFRRIRNLADFRRLVPLCTPLDLWHAYWSTAPAHLKGVTWPTAALGLASVNSSRPVPVTADLWSSHGTAWWTALAFACQSRPRAQVFDGDFVILGDQAGWSHFEPLSPHQISAADRHREVPALLRPFAVTIESNGRRGDTEFHEEALSQTIGRPVTMLAGETGRLLRYIAAVKHSTGRDDLRDVWPNLTAILFNRRSTSPDRAQLTAEIATRCGQAPLTLIESAVRPEAPLAVEDPRHGLPRLLPHHGVFFEFLPITEIHDANPTRHSIGEIELGVPYAVAVTSAAGRWACLSGWTVCFERRDPPLLRVLTASVVRGPAGRVDPAAFPFVQPPHSLEPSVLRRKIS